MDNVHNLYVSCSCNASPHCLDWGENGMVLFGSCNAVVLYDLQNKVILETLVGHEKPVTCVRWIRSGNSESEFISTSTDKKAIIWKKIKNVYKPRNVLLGHQSTVTVGDAVYCQESEDLIIATSSTDSTVKIWERNGDDNVLIQTIELGRAFALDLKVCLLCDKIPLIIIGGSDTIVSLYAPDGNAFVKVLSLYGHEDWIRGVDFLGDKKGNGLLASCSQDCFIRIWKFTCSSNLSKIDEDGTALKLTENVFLCNHNGTHLKYHVALESVSAGHENWIYSVHWQSSSNLSGPKLLSASMDKTMILWEFDEPSGIWLEKVRVGEVGGNIPGFYGGVFSPNGLSILAHGFQGALHLWNFKESGKWEPDFAISGHFCVVEDIAWEPQGHYLFSCSADQTTRLHAPCKQSLDSRVWHEISRPQVHGYDINCLTMINRYKFISGADEKVLRVFEAPKNFIKNIWEICKIDINSDLISEFAEGASVPSLGLSNKAVFENDIKNEKESEWKHPKDRYPESYFTPIIMHHPPSEDILLQNTLWPEIQKLYGHGYEIYAVACNHAGTIVASACKSNKIEHADIILWDVETWKQVCHLRSHTLTVTQIAFSPNDRYILSVSRDRTWALFERNFDQLNLYKRIAYSNKATGIHSRIIWSCAWSHDSMYFATASRDKTVIIWGSDENAETVNTTNKWKPHSVPVTAKDSIIAIDFAPTLISNGQYLIAAGLDNGEILLYTWKLSTQQLEDWKLFASLDCNTAHHKTVRRLKFSPVFESTEKEAGEKKYFHLASCGYDHCVKIYKISV